MGPCAVYILAGGQSSRFGSDKARAVLNDRPMIVRLGESMRSLNIPVVAVADVPSKYADLGLETIADDHPGLGPLAGLERALRHARDALSKPNDWVLLLSCDLVELRHDWLALLVRIASNQGDATIIAFHDADRWYPMPALYRSSILPHVEHRLETDHRSMRALLDAMHAVAVPLPADWPVIPQINTPDDLKAAANYSRNGPAPG